MLLLKTSANSLPGVLANAKHASGDMPNAQPGDLALVAQTRKKLRPGEKSIRYVMTFVDCVPDTNNESVRIWGRKWRYLIVGRDVREVQPFNLEDIQVSTYPYWRIIKHYRLLSEDEEAVLAWIGGEPTVSPRTADELAEEQSIGPNVPPEEVIANYDNKYANVSPSDFQRVVRAINRPSSRLARAIKEKYGHQCRVCGSPGFQMRFGGIYAEVHHVKELSQDAPGSLTSANLLVVCATCHRKLHYGLVAVAPSASGKGWLFEIEGGQYKIEEAV